jgi:hypothetical protein
MLVFYHGNGGRVALIETELGQELGGVASLDNNSAARAR